MWAPGRIPAGTTCDTLCGTIDLLPTISALSGSKLPAGRKIDGLDISKLLMGSNETPRKEFLHYASNGTLQGLRQGDYKLLIRKPGNRKRQPSEKAKTMLFNLKDDLGEQKNLATEKPEMVAQLTARMEELDAEITKNQRPAWRKE